MKKNVSGQTVGAQLVSATDGSNVTSGTTTVYLTGDGGTQASIGSATHEGNGYWSITPSQANTNYDHAAFTFVNSSAVSATVQVYTSFPQTGDAIAGQSGINGNIAIVNAIVSANSNKLNDMQGASFDTATDSLEAIRNRGDSSWTTGAGGSAPTAADIRAEIDNNSTQLAAILADTNELQGNQGDWATATGFATQASVNTIDSNVDAILVDTGTTIPAQISALNDISSADVTAAVPTTAEIEAALLNEGDGQQLIDAIVTAIGNENITAATIATEVWSAATRTLTASGVDLSTLETQVDELHKLQGLDASNPMTVTTTNRTTGSITQNITGNGTTTTTVTRA